MAASPPDEHVKFFSHAGRLAQENRGEEALAPQQILARHDFLRFSPISFASRIRDRHRSGRRLGRKQG
jgi:hypothetical protein